MDERPDVPTARIEPVTKTIGGITFDDPYQWLHEDTDEALEWQWRQDAVAERVARSSPAFEPLWDELREQVSQAGALMFGPPRKVGGRWFRMSRSPDGSGEGIYVAGTPDAEGKLLVDTTSLKEQAEDGLARMLTWWEPSPDARFVAFAVAAGGDMLGVWRVVDVSSGELLPLEAPALAYTGGTPGWLPDGSGFLLADRTEEGNHRIRLVRVVDQAGREVPDAVFTHEQVPPTVPGLTPHVSPGGRWALAVGQPHEHIALMLGDLETGQWRRFQPDGWHAECDGVWLDDDTYVARSHHEAPRGRVVAIPTATSTDPSTWREIAPESDAVLRGVTVVEDRVVLAEIKDVSVRFRLLHLDGTPDRVLPLDGPGTSRVAFVMRRFDHSEELTLDYETFVRAGTLYHYDVGAGRLTVLGEPGEELEGIAVSQRFAVSADGTQVPFFVIHRTDLDLSEPQPTLVNGYGGFNVALLPTYLRQMAPFVRAGGVFVQANLRGGAEYGAEWHDDGRLLNKQNTFDDLFAVAESVVASGLSTPERMAMQGGSNGGLLAGVAIVQRPDLWRVVAPLVPIFDQMQPFPPDPAYNAIRAFWLQEYGDPNDPETAKVLYSYSPYHNIRDGVSYPAVFQVFGEKDLGCPPFHGRKFTARLQAATSSGRPVMLRVWKNVGHGAGDPATSSAQQAEWLAFAMRELGMEYR